MYELLKTKAEAWFNKICMNSQLTPIYINIKIKDNNKRNKNCSNKIQTKSKLHTVCNHCKMHC